MRVVLTQHLTNNTRTLLVGLVAGIADAKHTIENTAMYGFETIAHIWKGTSYDYRH